MKFIPLTQGKCAMVSDRDYAYLNTFHWSAMKARKTFYAQRAVRVAKNTWKIVLMHRDLLGLTGAKPQVDHKDRNGLHNWRRNLRKATHSQNMQNRDKQCNNTSGFTGVRWARERWRAEIKID